MVPCGCLEGVLIVFDECIHCVCKGSGRFPEGIGRVSGGFLEGVCKVLWNIYGRCLEAV